ncbi:hypothetical protein DFS33DRAFT_1375023 [Desarmillaria ectypa]|nr:hypothetical protein DFS33DRAFT_1375023 [Desarmillaria ectypa]
MSATITFYDIPFKLPINAYSPNTWKARCTLSFKGIPYRTEWIEFPDIEALYKRLGVSASATKPDGVTPYYSLPLIHDLSTSAIISDTWTYPDTPRLLPPGTRALHSAFTSSFEAHVKTAIAPLFISAIFMILNPRCQTFYKQTREKSSGMTMEEMNPLGECKEKQWTMFKLGHIFVMGEMPTFADMTMCAWILCLPIVLGEDSPEWKDISSWRGGRWNRLMESFEKYETVV